MLGARPSGNYALYCPPRAHSYSVEAEVQLGPFPLPLQPAGAQGMQINPFRAPTEVGLGVANDPPHAPI